RYGAGGVGWRLPVAGAQATHGGDEAPGADAATARGPAQCVGARHAQGVRMSVGRAVAARVDVEVFTDGACLGHPGPGGWAALLRSGGREKLLAGGAAHTTNNRMELEAAIQALTALKRSCRVSLTTDSRY